MIFSSLTFLCVFLPAVFLLYCVIPSLKARNGLLIAASLLFYAYGEPVYVFLMLFSAVFNYACARLAVDHEQRRRRGVLIAALVVNLGILCVFKYAGFLAESINGLLHTGIPVPEIALPIGISFFTFQALSYVIDVYMGRVEAQKNCARVLLYISFFPQLIAGPIVKYRDISDAIEHREQSLERTAQGLRRFICGLGKKVLIANTVGQAADAVFAAGRSDVNICVAWIGAIAYLFQIYYDFSGYSDMAIGLGKMFGFEFKENFIYPYGSASVREFWRRWHISLSGWFREYLYIPLGGNRKGRARAALNRMIVFFFTGLWHGAAWTFVLWGLYHGVFLLLEEFVPFSEKLPRMLGRLYTLVVVCVGFVLFRADTIGQGLYMIGQMFTGFHFESGAVSLAFQQLTPWFLTMLAFAVIGCAPIRPLADRIRNGICPESGEAARTQTILQAGLYILAVLLLAWCMIRLSGSTYNPFIYFRF